MKAASLAAAGSIIVIANTFALIHAARNRVGSPDGHVTLTQRELRFFDRSLSTDNSGVTLTLAWDSPTNFIWSPDSVNWLDQSRLQALGFDSSIDPATPDAGRFYERQRPRQVFVALEYDGPAWRARREDDRPDTVPVRSHLVAIDADLDARNLRVRHPDRTKVLILPAVVAITLENFPYPGRKSDPAHPAVIRGRIQELPSSIHIPRPFSDEFRRRSTDKNLSYRVRLRFGPMYEPIVEGVDFTD